MSELVFPTCPKCDCRKTSRVKRNGFLQTTILPYVNRYPWECSGCRTTFTFKSRGKVTARKRKAMDVRTQAASN